MVVATHVEQGHAADHRVEQFGPLREHRADKQAAIAAALDAKVRRGGDAASDQVFGHRDEVVITALLVFLDRRLMPGRAEFAPAADVGHHIDTAALQPGAAGQGRIPGLERDLKAAVAVEQRGARATGRHRAVHAFGPDDEIGHACAVRAGGKKLFGPHAGGVEHVGQRLQALAGAACRISRLAEPQRIGAEEIGVDQQVVFGQRVVAEHRVVQRVEAQRAGEGRVDLAALETAGSAPPLLQAAGHVVEHIDQHMTAGGGETGKRAGRGGFEQHGEATLAGQVSPGIGSQQGAAGIGAATHDQVAAQFQQQSVDRIASAVPEGVTGVVRDVEFLQALALPVVDEILRTIEVERAHKIGAAMARCRVDAEIHADVAALTLEHGRSLCKGRAAIPALDDPGVTRIGQRAGAEITADIQRVLVEPINPALGFRQFEAVGDEGFGNSVELAHHGCIGPAARKRHEAQPVVGGQANGSAPDPVFTFGGAERVQVEYRFPARLGFPVTRQCGAAPQAARMGFVLPQVVEEITAT